MYTSQIYLQSQLRIFVVIFYSVRSQHVSAPTGHPQVKYNIIIYNITQQHVPHKDKKKV
jgi:hypothetical protein